MILFYIFKKYLSVNIDKLQSITEMKLNSNQSSQLKSQSPRGMPIRHVALTQKRMTDKFQYGQNSPRNNFTNNKRRGTSTIESATADASI